MQAFIIAAIKKALTAEVSCAPKAGLVCPNSNGAHSDMDYALFIKSIEAIMPFFAEAASLFNEKHEIPSNAFDALRQIGVRAESAMLHATNGVNTHKGAIFSLLILSASAMICANRGELHAENICKTASKIAAPSLLDFEQDGKSSGMALYKKLGVLGIRGEAASGFASVLSYGLPILKAALENGASENAAHVEVLTCLMANCTDTNVLARSGVEGLELVQEQAKALLPLKGEALIQGQESLNLLLVERNISPGGCADLLGVTIFLYEVTMLDNVLADREKRYKARLEAARGSGKTVVSVTMCAPIAFRGSPDYEWVFHAFLKELEAFFKEHETPLEPVSSGRGADGEFTLYTTGMEAKAMKILCIKAEESLKMGRLFDVDILNSDGESVGRCEVSSAARACLVCKGDAATCVSRRLHSRTEVANAVKKILSEK